MPSAAPLNCLWVIKPGNYSKWACSGTLAKRLMGSVSRLKRCSKAHGLVVLVALIGLCVVAGKTAQTHLERRSAGGCGWAKGKVGRLRPRRLGCLVNRLVVNRHKRRR